MQASATSRISSENLTVLGVIDRTFQIYRDNFMAFFLITLIFTIPIAIIDIPLSIAAQNELNADPLNNNLAPIETLVPLVNLIIVFVQTVIIQSTLCYIASENHNGVRTTYRDAFRAVRSRFGMITGGYLLFGVFIFLLAIVSALTLFCFVGFLGFVFMFYLSVAVQLFLLPVLTLEMVKPRQAIGRAWHLGKRRIWRGMGLYILIGLITVVLTASLTLVAELAYMPLYSAGYDQIVIVLQTLVENLLAVAVTPILPIALTIFYYDARVRLEGLDIEYYLVSKPYVRPDKITSPIHTGRFIEGQDILNMVSLTGIVIAIYGMLALVIYVFVSAVGF